METDEAVVKAEPSSQTSTTSSTPVPPAQTAASAAVPVAVTTAVSGNTVIITKTKQPAITLPEVDIYLHLLVLLFAIDRQKYKQVRSRLLLYDLSTVFIYCCYSRPSIWPRKSWTKSVAKTDARWILSLPSATFTTDEFTSSITN